MFAQVYIRSSIFIIEKIPYFLYIYKPASRKLYLYLSLYYKVQMGNVILGYFENWGACIFVFGSIVAVESREL